MRRACDYLAANPRHRGMSDKVAGRTLGLSRFDREACRITTMDAVDDPRAARARRKAMEKTRRERERGEARRRKAGAVPRGEYLANSLSRLEPWKEQGISRRTYYRRMKQSEQKTDLAQVRPPTYIRYILG